MRSVPFGEADLVASFFTKESGKVSTIVRGARRSTKRFGGALEPLHELAISLEDKGKELCVLAWAAEPASGPPPIFSRSDPPPGAFDPGHLSPPWPDAADMQQDTAESNLERWVLQANAGRARAALITGRYWLEQIPRDPQNCDKAIEWLQKADKLGSNEAAGWLVRELHIVQPKLVVAMGERSVAFVDALAFPLAEPLAGLQLGSVGRFTPTIDALVTPDIDESLDEQAAKTAFWNAFKALGPWWAELPPY